jgi:endonuclease YncB( thermonuclease family)
LVALVASSSALFVRAPAQSGRLLTQASQIAVVDGGTLRLGQTVVRLAGIEPPQRGRTCRTAEGGAVDCGTAAANALAGLVRKRDVDCRLRGADRLGRPLAYCEAGGIELNRALVSEGWVRAAKDAPELSEEEKLAKLQRRGLWIGQEASW